MPHRVSTGRLRFQRAGDATQVLAAYADTPLRILTPRNHGAAAWAYTSTLGGGLVGGDRFRMDVDLGPAACAYVSTQGPTRVYRSPHACESIVHARVGDGATLMLLPDHVSCFAGSSYRQHTELELSGAASAVSWDVLTAGRTAFGERWAFRRYLASFKVSRDGRALVDDALLLSPEHGDLIGRLGRFNALATLFLIGPRFEAARAKVRASIDSAPIAPDSWLLSAASPIGADGLLVRLAARSLEELFIALREHLAQLPALLGDDPWARRN